MLNSSRLRFFAPLGAKKERDEELALFREMFKREKEKNMNLLDSVSTEIEPIEGNSAVFKLSSGKKGGSFTNDEKNDYDWLKTPPATPLFQSLEMDAAQANNTTNMIVHKEIPIVPPLKPSRFSSITEEPKLLSKSSRSPSVSSLSSSSSSRHEVSDLRTLSPPKITSTPRFGGVRDPSLGVISTPRFIGLRDPLQKYVDPEEEAPRPKLIQTRRLISGREESKSGSKSPGSSRPSTAASSRPETPDTNSNLNPKYLPSRAKVGPTAVSRGKTIPKPIEKSVKRSEKDVPPKPKQDTKLPTRRLKTDPAKPRPVSPSARSVISTASTRPETSDPNPELKGKEALKNPKPNLSETPVKKSAAKQNPNPKPNSRTVSHLVKSSFPATLPEFPDEAPPNLITSVASSRSTSATRSRPGIPVTGGAETNRSPSVTKLQKPTASESAAGRRGIEKRGNGNGGVLGSSMVDKMLNARRSTPAVTISGGEGRRR